MPEPLAGINVFEVSQIYAGPYAGETLSDLGADVVSSSLRAARPSGSGASPRRGRARTAASLNLASPFESKVPVFDAMVTDVVMERVHDARRRGAGRRGLQRARPG